MKEITIKSLASSLFPDEKTCLQDMLPALTWDKAQARAVYRIAKTLVTHMRDHTKDNGTLESFLKRFPLTSDEGLALMCMAESLLRIPDTETANTLIADKMNTAHWGAQSSGDDLLLRTAGLGLAIGNKAINSPLSHIALPVIRSSLQHVVQKMGREFVLGEDIDEAMARANPYEKMGYRMSYDMLGEAARTQADADAYFQSYKNAIHTLQARLSRAPSDMKRNPGISVKLSALHPRYSMAHRDLCIPAISTRMIELCRMAAKANITLTIDAEESERLTLSLEIFERLLQMTGTENWHGLGLAVQAYQKRALSTIQWAAHHARKHKRVIQIRLVKGAYWDREIKRAQTLGLPGYPVFTRKCNTDVNYLACAQYMLQHNDIIHPMFATHNAHTIAAILKFTQGTDAAFEFQKLHGMGNGIYAALIHKNPKAAVTVYAPVGPYKELLPYLVRRMLENGSNSSFVNKLQDDSYPEKKLLHDPIQKALDYDLSSHTDITFPLDLFLNEHPRERINSHGFDLDDAAVLDILNQRTAPFLKSGHHYEAHSLVNGRPYKNSDQFTVYNPAIRAQKIGTVSFAHEQTAERAVNKAYKAFPSWMKSSVQQRTAILLNYADLLEDYTHELLALLMREAGKTLRDSQAEIREAIDFCRYYANQIGGLSSAAGISLPGPTGERNIYRREGRGVFICISPWNFPLAIFTGQIAAALICGNTVVAKPAEQTSLIAHFAVRLWHRAGIPADVLNLVIGDGFTGATLVNHPKVGGVVFTGSIDAARSINQSLALKNGPIAPLIAETGGQNAMIIDSSALPEQAVDDVINSAFGSAGQRCSALRIVFVQDDIAPVFMRLLQGAMQEIRIGDPQHISSDIGPIIDAEARSNLLQHCVNLEGFATLIAQTPLTPEIESSGTFFAPRAYELKDLHGLEREVFGPILHIIRYNKDTLDGLLDDLNAMGYALTLGIHSRIEGFTEDIIKKVHAGNVYVNRSMIGAVVGSQPFGGHGLSGTGPKAGGPDYLQRFMNERVISTDTTATGGNAGLVSLRD